MSIGSTSRADRATPLGVLYTLFLRSNLSRVRIAGLLALGVIGVVLGVVARQADDPLETGAETVLGVYGLATFVPLAALAFGTAMFGNLIDDKLLVYVWMRPVPRWMPALAAYAATLTITAPLTVIPLVVAAAVTGAGDLVPAAVLASTLGLVAYSGVFLALGARLSRALLWGLGYILVWEGFVASAGSGTARLSIRSYTWSVISHESGVDLSQGDRSIVAAVVVPLAVAAAGVALTVVRLRRMEVD